MDKVTNKMLKNFDAIIKSWKVCNCDDTKEHRAVYAADRRNLRAVYNFIVKGDYKNACEYAKNMDTILREMIPEDIWNIITDEE